MRGRRGGVKGVPIYKTLALPPSAVRTYYWIQDYVKREGRFPTYYGIGCFLGGNPHSYYTTRNIGIRLVQRWLEPSGFVVRENRVLRLSDKPFTEENIVVPTDSRPRH